MVFLDAQRLHGRSHNAFAVETDFDAQAHAQPAHLEHAAAKRRAVDRGFHRRLEIASALNQGFAVLRVENKNVVIVIRRLGAHRIELRERANGYAVEGRTDFGKPVERAMARNVVQPCRIFVHERF